jgi:hypothetical protein
MICLDPARADWERMALICLRAESIEAPLCTVPMLLCAEVKVLRGRLGVHHLTDRFNQTCYGARSRAVSYESGKTQASHTGSTPHKPHYSSLPFLRSETWKRLRYEFRRILAPARGTNQGRC